MRRRVLLTLSTAPLYNTLIGGEGINTTTAGQLETLLGLSPGDVSYFNLNGNDIEAFIDVSYEIPASAFDSNTDITSFVDLDNLVTALNYRSFYLCSNLSGDIQFLSVTGTVAGNSIFQGCSSITSIHTGMTGSTSSNMCKGCTSLVSFTSTNPITSVASYQFDGCTSLVTFDLSNLTNTAVYSFRNCAFTGTLVNNVVTSGWATGSFQDCNFTGLESSSLTTLPQNCFWGNNFTSLNLDLDCPSLISLGTATFRSCSSLTSVIGNNLLSIGTSCFRDTNLNTIELTDIDLEVGVSNTTSDNVFTGVPLSGTATFHARLSTINAGGLEPDIDYLDNTRSWTINYVPTSGINYVDVSASSIILNCFGFDVSPDGKYIVGFAGNSSGAQKILDKKFITKNWTSDGTPAGFNTVRGTQFVPPNRLFIGEESGDGSISSYTTTGYDANTKVFTGVLDVSGQDTLISAFYVTPDGTKIFVLGTSTDRVFAYTMSTPYDLDTATYDSVFYATGLADPNGLSFSPDGEKMFILDKANNLVREYPLTTGWDLTTVGAQSGSLDYSTEATSARYMNFGAYGFKLYIMHGSSGANNIYEYDVNPPYSF